MIFFCLFLFSNLPSLPSLLLIHGVLALLVGPGEKEAMKESVTSGDFSGKTAAACELCCCYVRSVSISCHRDWQLNVIPMLTLNTVSFYLRFSTNEVNCKSFQRAEIMENYVNEEKGAYHWASGSSWSYNLCE